MNGVIVQLPSIGAGGALGASGNLIFGIGTQSNNALGGATILTANGQSSPDAGNFTTNFDGQTGLTAFIDSGSNALYFPNSTSAPITECGTPPYPLIDFYCPASNPPTSPLDLSAVMVGENTTTSAVSFQIVDLNQLDTNYFAQPDVGATASSFFDWGLPFFYGRTVYVAIDGADAGGTNGPYYAF